MFSGIYSAGQMTFYIIFSFRLYCSYFTILSAKMGENYKVVSDDNEFLLELDRSTDRLVVANFSSEK